MLNKLTHTSTVNIKKKNLFYLQVNKIKKELTCKRLEHKLNPFYSELQHFFP